MKQNIVKEKSFDFAVRIVNLYKYITDEKREFIIAKQLLRSGTAPGSRSLIRDAEHAESKLDFIHKLAIAQKEINETLYWLELLKATDYLSETQCNSIFADADEIMSLVTSIIKTTKRNLNK